MAIVCQEMQSGDTDVSGQCNPCGSSFEHQRRAVTWHQSLQSFNKDIEGVQELLNGFNISVSLVACIGEQRGRLGTKK